MLRKFGFKKSEPRESEARQKLQKELFSFKESADHGFPHKPSALAYDRKLKLLAIGTKSGALKIVGSPGVEVTGQHSDDVAVTKIFFLPDQGRLITLCSDNSLHLWEINQKDGVSILEDIKKYAMEASKLKTISSCCLTSDSEQLLMGTEGGNIHILDVNSFSPSTRVIYQDVVMQNVPDDFKVNPGAVESIAQQPTDPNKFLIGYNRGLVVLWDNKKSNADQTYNASQQLESLSWHRDGTQFMTAHVDGSYIIWATNDSTKPKEQANTPYGPFPCKAITNIAWKAAKADNYIIFAGGMPRPSYADRHSVSIMQGAKQVVFDFTSRVIDFVVLSSTDDMDDVTLSEYDDPQSVIVLVEEELVAIDLQSEGWPTFKQPYLCSPHSSAITCSAHAADVPEQLWNKIIEAGEAQMSSYSSLDWPILGGKNNAPESKVHDLLLTGHEDGTVRFWDASTVAMRMIYKLGTAGVLGFDFPPADQANDGEEEWPPFRKVGTFDPYSDDPRLGIQKVAFCPISETLVVAGTAGQVIVHTFEHEEKEIEVTPVTVNIVSDREAFIWKGHDALTVREGAAKYSGGFQPAAVMQLHPPAACTALAVQSEWQLVAAGTAHGMGVFDYAQKKEVATKCTLNPNDMTGTGDSAMSRRKSFKKSLRESFRRLRTRRSERRKKAEEKVVEEKEDKKTESPKKEAAAETEEKKETAEGEAAAAAPATEEGATAPSPTPEAETTPTSAPTTPIEPTRTIERAIEARAADDAMASMVRFLYFADTFLINGQNHTPTLWTGTNAGTIFVHQITVPANDKRDSEAVTCQLGKEIHLKHRAPVIAICILDRNAYPLPGPMETSQGAKAPDMTGGHQVVICSEEQFKIFSLPSLKPQNKFKLTAHEGSKVRKVGFVNFTSKSDENYCEHDLVILTNQGDLQVYTVPHLRRQLKANAIRKDNVNGIVSGVLSKNGQGFYSKSPSEFARFSLSARIAVVPLCEIELKEGMRPPPPEPEPEQTTEEQTEAAGTDATDADTAAKEEGDKAASPAAAADGTTDADKTEEQTPAEGANDTIASADLTIDSVKVHLSETEVHSSSMTSTVITRTIVQETTEGGVTTSSETTTVVTSSEGGAIMEADSNLDDDTKITRTTEQNNEGPAEVLPELKITEEGDEAAPTPAITPEGNTDSPPVSNESPQTSS